MYKIDMKEYGLNEKLISEAADYQGFYVGRILSQSKGTYRVVCENGEFFAEISGKLRFEISKKIDYPAVGDFIMLDRNCGKNGNGIIHHVLSRKSTFIRKAAGKSGEEQVVAANVDALFFTWTDSGTAGLFRCGKINTH